jgi:predicted small secreted protein
MRTTTLVTALTLCLSASLTSGCGSTARGDGGDGTSTTPDVDSPAVVIYQMDERAGAAVMKDSGGSGVDGKIGGDIVTGAVVDATHGYRFPTVDPGSTSVHPRHLATIPDSPAIDPGSSTYSVTIRYLTTEANGANLIQKGQAHSPGGQFKIQVPEGKPQCLFKGSEGRLGASSPARIDDGRWHTLRCTRTPPGVSLYVDGVLRKRHAGTVGAIDNSFPMTIGGKPQCDMVKVECDYFGGVIDYVRIDKR